MPINSPRDHHQRRSIRLPGYDYAQPGAYFVTLCTHDREALFGEVMADAMRLNPYGEIVSMVWQDLPRHYPRVELDAFVIMPNHVHGIIVLNDDDGVGAGLRPAPTLTKRHPLSEIVRAFKSFSARRINALRATPGVPVWQRNYYEHIIRNELEWDAIRKYIDLNPDRWALDHDHPANSLHPQPNTSDLYWREAGLE